MPMHPAAPEDLHGLVEAYAQTTRAVVDLGHSCSEADFTLQTECPGWTVHDQIAHVAGVESMLEGHRDPEVELPDYDHLGNELSHLTERAVEVRRNRRSQDVVSELEHVLGQRLSSLRSPGLSADSIIPGPFGPAEAATVAMMRTFDIWAHEQDIRIALGRPGHLEGPAVDQALEHFTGFLPYVVGTRAGAPDGARVVVEIAGHEAIGVEVVERRARRTDALPVEPDTTVRTDVATFVALVNGRVDASDAGLAGRIEITGDQVLGRAIVENLSVMV